MKFRAVVVALFFALAGLTLPALAEAKPKPAASQQVKAGKKHKKVKKHHKKRHHKKVKKHHKKPVKKALKHHKKALKK